MPHLFYNSNMLSVFNLLKSLNAKAARCSGSLVFTLRSASSLCKYCLKSIVNMLMYDYLMIGSSHESLR